jgi:uncharacterized protein YgiM (DUF1202 family)
VKASRFSIIAVLLVILSTTGCNLPSNQTVTPNAYTAAAMTVTALAGTEQVGPPSPTVTLFATFPPPTVGSTNTAAPLPPPVVQATATPNGTYFVTDVGANCRTGPGTNYDRIASFVQGTFIPLVGRNADSTWWVVLTGGSKCWISGTTGHTTGPLGSIPVVTAPPTPTPGATATATGATSYP